ncbi:hypothetical protein EMILIAHAH_134 [Bacillus phage vB_BanH_Emiliahah]|nr:hypothetical protein MCCARTNEY_133 [Bacillus phage vB_BanH_McCartney]UGO49220.1 hypothetical protein EMILIAHAH_134 [Bacillus phage vB_BanH_Emiliahah]
MLRDSHGDIIANTLHFYRERTKTSSTVSPSPFAEIKAMLQKTVDEGKRVMIDIRDSYSVQTVVVRFEYIHDRWAMGKSICYYDGEEVEVPYTIHYSDIFCNKKMNVKVIVEGENPFDA